MCPDYVAWAELIRFSVDPFTRVGGLCIERVFVMNAREFSSFGLRDPAGFRPSRKHYGSCFFPCKLVIGRILRRRGSLAMPSPADDSTVTVYCRLGFVSPSNRCNMLVELGLFFVLMICGALKALRAYSFYA